MKHLRILPSPSVSLLSRYTPIQQIPVITPDDCWSLRQGKPHVVSDIDHGLVCRHLKNCPEHGYTCVPIIAQGDMVGMIHLQFPKHSENLTQEEINHNIEAKRRLVNMTADNLALALVSLKLREALKIQSIKDPLTKLFNRRYMEETLEREYLRCKRSDELLGILMLDIDHFKWSVSTKRTSEDIDTSISIFRMQSLVPGITTL